MKKKYKNLIVIIMVVIVILCISLFYFLARYYNNAQHYLHKGVDLETDFLEEFPGNYTEILWVKQDDVAVSLNLENISEIEATADGKEKRFGTEPGKTFVVVMEDEFDDIVFLTEDGEEIPEKKFLE